MKRYVKWLVVLFGILVALLILIITLGRGDTSKNRKIAEDLLKYHRNPYSYSGWEELETLNNLPFPHSRISDNATSTLTFTSHAVIRRGNAINLDEYYWIENSTSNPSAWTLYHAWALEDHPLSTHKLLTLVETNTEMRKAHSP